jgi:periplasmic protein TonB
MNTEITLINNNGYGAPELKKAYQATTMKGLIIAVTLHVALIAAYMLIAYINESKAKDIPILKKDAIIVDLDKWTPPPMEEEIIPPVKEEPIAPKVKDLASLQPEPVRKDIADDVKLKTQDELNNITNTTGREGDSIVIADNRDIKIDDSKIEDKVKDIEKPIKDIYTLAEVQVAPECTNLAQVKSSMEYPEFAREIGTEGRVSVKVLVDGNGNVIKIGSMSGPDVFYDEVREKAKNLQFTPGLQNNQPVKVWVTVPFSFKLE